MLILPALNTFAQAIEQPRSGDGWIKLFNGEDLTGWTPKIKGYPAGENFADTFRVEDGVLKVSYDNYVGDFKDRFGHLFYNQPFSNYVLKLEYRIVGEQTPNAPAWALRNSGIMIHGQKPESMTLDQDFPVSIEVQLLGGDGTHTRHTGNLCTPGTHVVKNGKLLTQHCVNSTSPTYHGDQWVTAEVEVDGSKLIRHKINGEVVLEYSQPQLDDTDTVAKKLLAAGAEKLLTGGTISLQSEGHPVEFRNVELLNLEQQR
ncbi:3-keto-disaccharide hydrolase [Bythopirellula polymerisocia]|uniref:3-keto-alpha-glucoside-1,2-lyase/3-keto-2-hydroxy-glucal hydratase domain-containing protein n=1 Tax=Bythopirellula polymerisocia TaxID=2528003 RepID=A0A5C6CIZ4_9BACT|nr:DUF1080 domain-containing protein [Bythopirellula polymerisocia]TWU24763.1 hypothetical protein Pla144_36490 [Bythopirellula polymerisocia]